MKGLRVKKSIALEGKILNEVKDLCITVQIQNYITLTIIYWSYSRFYAYTNGFFFG